MRTIKRVLCPERLRRVPAQFSWIDQRLVQEHFIERGDAAVWALYLLLVTVADAHGLSYYGDDTVCRRLHLSAAQLAAARQQLLTLGLIAYQAPLYQVLALPGAPPPRGGAGAARSGAVALSELLQAKELRRDRL